MTTIYMQINKVLFFLNYTHAYQELSNIIYSCLLTMTVVQNLVWSTQLNVYLTSWYSANYCHRTARKYHAAYLIAFHLSAYD